MSIRKNIRHRRAARAIIAAGDGISPITPNDMHTMKLALQSRVRDMHAAGKHEAAEAAMVTLNKIQRLIDAVR